MEHDPDRAMHSVPFDGAVALRLLPGECTLALAAAFSCDPAEAAEPPRIPTVFMTHAEEGGATSYLTTRLAASSSERAADGAEVMVFYEAPFRPARAGQHVLLIEVADGPRIESREWMIPVRHADDA